MAVTNQQKGVWSIDKVFAKQNQGSIWDYSGSGHLYSWGENGQGYLGQNDRTQRSSPTQIPGEWGMSALVSVGYGVLATKTNGTLWGWGRNSNGELGLGDSNRRSSPTQVPGTKWRQVTSSGNAGACIRTDGTLWLWGNDGNGQLGQNNRTSYASPVQIYGEGTTWSRICGGDSWYLAIKTDGTMWSWGENAQGQLGIGNKTQRSSPIQIPGTNWSDICTQRDGAWAIRTDGSLWSWGSNNEGQLGHNNKSGYSSPRQVGTDTSWARLADLDPRAGGTAMATKTDGTLWMWGRAGDFGILCNGGTGGSFDRSSPIQVPGTNWSTTIRPYCNSQNGAAIKTDGTGWIWGGSEDGNLGRNVSETEANARTSSPVQLPGSWQYLRPTGSGCFGVKSG